MEEKRQFKRRLMEATGKVDSSFQSKALDDMKLILDSGVNSFSELLEVASNEDLETEIRSIACWFLSRLGDDRAIPVLVKCLNDKDPDLRSEAARSLGTIASVHTAPVLIETLKQDLSAEVRLYAIYALGLIGNESAVAPILETLLDANEEPEVRGMAAETLSVFLGQQVVETLITCLSDTEAEVRYWSAFALGELGAKQALPELSRLMGNDESCLPDGSSVKDEAADAIKKIKEVKLD